jgi:hypothetical protein
VQTDDKVTFDLKLVGGADEVTAIHNAAISLERLSVNGRSGAHNRGRRLGAGEMHWSRSALGSLGCGREIIGVDRAAFADALDHDAPSEQMIDRIFSDQPPARAVCDTKQWPARAMLNHAGDAEHFARHSAASACCIASSVEAASKHAKTQWRSGRPCDLSNFPSHAMGR